MRIEIISYNQKAVNASTLLFHAGFVLLLTNAIPYVWNNYGMLVASISLIILFSAIISLNYFQGKNEQVGFIYFEKDITKIDEGQSSFEIINAEFCVKFSKLGYEGKSNYIPFLTIGAFTASPGINSISFYNEQKKFNYEIIVRSKSEYENLMDVLSNNFKEQN